MIFAAATRTAYELGRASVFAASMLRGGRGSIAIACVTLIAAIWVLPIHIGRVVPQQFWRVPAQSQAGGMAGQRALAVGLELPVFCLPPTGTAIRCGIARVSAPARISFSPFRNMRDTGKTIPVLAASDIGLLWALSDPPGQEAVRDSAAKLVQQIIASVKGLTQSEIWQREYRPSLRALLDRITARAWNAPDTQRAVDALIQAIEPLARDGAADEIGPVIGAYMADAIWGVVKSNTPQVFSLLGGSKPDLSAVSKALRDALRDPAIRPALERLGPKILTLPQTELLTERFVSNFTDAAQRDPQTFDLLSRIVTDPRLSQGDGSVRANAGVFLRQLGQVLWGIGNDQALNALAGLALKATIANTVQPLILLLDADSSMALMRAMPGGATLLVPDSPA